MWDFRSAPTHSAAGDQLLDVLMQHAGCAVCGYDAQERITFWNDCYVAFFPEVAPFLQVGTPVEDTLEAFLKLQHPTSTPPMLADAMRNALYRHAHETGPIQYQRADGRWMELRMFPLAQGGRFKLWREVGAPALPGTESALLHRLIAAVNVGLTVHDAGGQLRYVNARFFSEHFLSLVRDIPAIQERRTQGAYWRLFKDIFLDDPEYQALCSSDVSGPLPEPVTLQARSHRFYLIQEQWWEQEIVSVWTDVTDLIMRKNALRRAHEELSQANLRLIELSETDTLTGLANRRRFNAQLQRAQDAVHAGGSAAVAVFDLDFFKAVNDRYGHDIGDLVLIEAATRLRACQSDTVCVARLGGEEFGIVFRDLRLTQALAVCDSLRRSFVDEPIVAEHHSVRVTVSAGVVRLLASRTQHDSLKEADGALWKAKSAGRDCVIAEAEPSLPGAQAPASPPADIASAEDRALSPDGLRDKYAAFSNRHPVYTRADWQASVRAGQTLDDYWGWVSYCLTAED